MKLANSPRAHACVGTVLVLGALGCDGQILGKSDTSGPGLSSDPSSDAGPGSGAGVTNTGPTDDELRAKDPGLFDIALKYFPDQAAAPGKKRLFRLTRQQLDLTTQNLLPKHYGVTALASLPRDPLQTNYEYADNLSFSAANFTPLTEWVEQMTAKVKADPASVVDCAADKNSAACLQTAAQDFVRRAFRGVASDATLTRFSDFFSASVAEVGIAEATADLVNITLTSPGYVFREEVQTAADQRLLPVQLLQNLSYTLADSPPEAVGLTAPAANAKALRDSDVTQAVEQVLATPAARAKLLRFFTTWLEVKEPQDFDLSASVYPEFTPAVAAAVVDDTRRFLTAQLGTALPTLRDVTETTNALVSAPSAFLYGLSTAPSDGKVALDPLQRLGIFSQPAVLASHSGPTTTRLVKRGVFFTRKVMCLPLGAPPQGVNTTIPAEVMGTERQRVESVTNEPRCLGCHAFINPFGFMQENFDAMGRYRTMDAGQPVDAAINVDFLDEGPLSVSSPVDALRGFTRSLRFQQCFTRQLFRFYSGRDETAADDPLLRQLFFEFAQNSAQDIIGMLRHLAAAPAFNSRSEAP
jgi:Protein of unknown function (DUF1588)/Protein of unknown function (DUF1592)